MTTVVEDFDLVVARLAREHAPATVEIPDLLEPVAVHSLEALDALPNDSPIITTYPRLYEELRGHFLNGGLGVRFVPKTSRRRIVETSEPTLRRPKEVLALEEATERLNDLLSEAERKLGAMRYGVPAVVDMGHGFALRFEKQGDRWLLLVSSGRDGEPLPLRSQARGLRCLAAAHLGALRDALRDNVAAPLEQVEDACTAVEKFVCDL